MRFSPICTTLCAIALCAGSARGDTPIAADPDDPTDDGDMVDVVVEPKTETHVAVDPPPPPPVVQEQIASDPPAPPPPEVPRSALVMIGSALTARMPEGASRVADLGRGAALSLGWLQRRGDVPTGFAFRALFLGGRDSRLYGLDLQLIASAKLKRNPIAPFIGIGLAFGAVRFADGDDKHTASTNALGPAGSLGLHGFLGNQVYWRAEVGAVGAGGAVINGGLSLGWVVGT